MSSHTFFKTTSITINRSKFENFDSIELVLMDEKGNRTTLDLLSDHQLELIIPAFTRNVETGKNDEL
tara:strand:- start:3728 stop:3928 length:201 start_codon:yes stop_codon:yes gene_type:complete